MATDYLAVALASIPASVGVGIGISFGQDAYKWMKYKIQEHRKKINLNKWAQPYSYHNN